MEKPSLAYSQSKRDFIPLYIVLAVYGAAIGRYAVPFGLEYAIGVLPLAVAVVLFVLYRTQLPSLIQDCSTRGVHVVDRAFVATIVLALTYASFLVVGSWYMCTDSTPFNVMHIIAIVSCAFPIFLALRFFWSFLDRYTHRKNQETRRKEGGLSATSDAVTQFVSGTKWPVVCFVVLILCWTPIYLAAYPGYFCYDMYELTWFQDGDLSSHFPILHSIIMGSVVTLFENVFGSVNAGVAVYIALQGILCATIFALMLNAMRLLGVPTWLSVASLIYLAFDPMVSMFVLCSTRDTLFAGAAVLYLVVLSLFLSVHEKPSRGFCASLIISGFLFIVLRPNALPVFVLFILCLAFIARGILRKWALGLSMISLALALVWLGPVTTLLDAFPSAYQRLNIFSVPMQQISYVVNNNTLDGELMLPEDEVTLIEDKLGTTTIMYAPALSDDARYAFMQKTTTTGEDFSAADMMELYIGLGMKHPAEYLYAFIAQTQMAWNPYSYSDVYPNGGVDGEIRTTSLHHANWEAGSTSDSKFPVLTDALHELSGELVFQNIPLLGLLVSIPFYIWVVLLVLARSIISGDRAALSVSVLLALLVLSFLVGPAQLIRYYLPLVFGLPLLLTALLRDSHQVANEPVWYRDATPVP